MPIEFAKMHGLGNDFVILDGIRQTLPPALLTSENIARIADRRYGIGCDQLLLLQEATMEGEDFLYRIFNADGGEVGQCGNGARCVHRYIQKHRLSDKEQFRLQTGTTRITTTALGDGDIRAVMQRAEFIGRISCEPYEFHHIDIGNPHAVCFGEMVDETTLKHIGETLNNRLAGGINVSFAVRDGDGINLRVYERGAGLTRACGSAAVAAASIAISEGGCANPINVRMPGGSLRCGINDDNRVFLQGEVAHVFDGTLTAELAGE